VRAHPRLSINQATIKHADLRTALELTAAAGYEAIGLWREPVAEVGLATACAMLRDSGLRFTTSCRAGFFTGTGSPDDNRRAIDETAELAAAGAPGSTPTLVIVAGGLPPGSRDLAGSRARVRDAIGELVPHARDAGVTLAIEPLHPLYATDRCVVSTLAQALDLAEPFPPSEVAVTVDTFHVFWDPGAIGAIERAGREGRIATYQVCDWKTPLAADVLLSRHYPGDGMIDFAALTRAVEATGYDRDIEVEIFHADIWARDPRDVLEETAQAFEKVVAPHLLHAPVPSVRRETTA
jgi:sugar phosphate isomerase/epimerase